MASTTASSSSRFADADIALIPIRRGRTKAVAKKSLKRGQTILQGPPAAVIPLPGIDRCSRCLKAQVTVGCAQCGAEGYCSDACRDEAFEQYHAGICAALPAIHNAARRLQWGEDTLGTALLLAQTAATNVDVIEQVLDLLPAPGSDPNSTDICNVVSQATGIAASKLQALLCRFSNNNHQLETEALYPAGIAVLPKISRACNHSCTPTGVLCTRWREGVGLTVGVRLLRDLAEGEEVTIPYLDPIQDLSKRRRTLSKTYGFDCACPRCIFSEANPSPRSLSLSGVVQLESSSHEMVQAVYQVIDHTETIGHARRLPDYGTLLPKLRHHVHPDNVSHVSKCVLQFVDLGDWSNAARSSMYLCALYTVIYGPTWPLLGTQLLATASYYLNDALSGPAEVGGRILSLASSFAALADMCLFATVASGGWLETGESDTGPREGLVQVREAIQREMLATSHTKQR